MYHSEFLFPLKDESRNDICLQPLLALQLSLHCSMAPNDGHLGHHQQPLFPYLMVGYSLGSVIASSHDLHEFWWILLNCLPKLCSRKLDNQQVNTICFVLPVLIGVEEEMKNLIIWSIRSCCWISLHLSKHLSAIFISYYSELPMSLKPIMFFSLICKKVLV